MKRFVLEKQVRRNPNKHVHLKSGLIPCCICPSECYGHSSVGKIVLTIPLSSIDVLLFVLLVLFVVCFVCCLFCLLFAAEEA